MRPDASGTSSFLRPFWAGFRTPPWLLSLALLAILAAARYYAVFGPPPARILYLLHLAIMIALPFVLLTPDGRRRIGLRRQGNSLPALALSACAGAICGLTVFAVGMALYGNSADNWCLSIRDSFQIEQLRPHMPSAAILAVILLPATLLSPVAEEIFFRGILHHSFAERWNIVSATIVNGLAFGLIHLHVHGLWRDAAGFQLRLVSGALMVLLLALASAVFTLCRERTGSLYAAMAAHAACNLTMLSAVFFVYVR